MAFTKSSIVFKILVGYVFVSVVVIGFAIFSESDSALFASLISLITFPWIAAINLLTTGRFDDGGAIFFGLMPAYFINALILYYLLAKLVKLDPKKLLKEIKYVPWVIVGGYLVWTAELLYYASVCTGKFCGLVVIMSFGPLLFLSEMINLFDDVTVGYVLIGLNAFLMFVIAHYLGRFVTRKLKK